MSLGNAAKYLVEDNNKEWLDFISGMKSGGDKKLIDNTFY